MPNTSTLRLIDGLRFSATSGSGHTITLDSRARGETGGMAGMSPMELVLAALGSCGGMDVVSILRKMRQEVTSYEIAVNGERSSVHPKVYTAITMTHRLAGAPLTEANVRRAIELSMTSYCPVFAMISATVPVAVWYELESEGARYAGQLPIPNPAESD